MREYDQPSQELKLDDDYYEAGRDVEIRTFSDPDSLILNYDPDIHGHTLFMGMDVGRTHDATAFYILGQTKDDRRQSVFRLELKNTSFDMQKDTFRKLMRNLPIYRACIDRTGIGMQLSEEMRQELGDRVEGVLMTLQSKEVLAMDVKLRLERREFLLENNRAFHSQIHSIKRIPSQGGAFRYDSGRNEEGHADSFWAWVLASHAMGNSYDIVPGFYSEYHSKKTETVIESTEISGNTSCGLTSTRGRSLDGVLRRVRRANR